MKKPVRLLRKPVAPLAKSVQRKPKSKAKAELQRKSKPGYAGSVQPVAEDRSWLERSLGSFQLAQLGRRLSGAQDFIETGTCTGWMAAKAAGVFERVVTIELDAQLSQRASARYPMSNVTWFVGHSPDVLSRQVLPGLTGPAVFWLDAHCCDPAKLPEGGRECPLFEELDLICRHRRDHFILIDDARMLLAAPAKPHRSDHWPDLLSIVELVQRHYGAARPYLAVISDVLLVLEGRHAEAVKQFWQDSNRGPH